MVDTGVKGNSMLFRRCWKWLSGWYGGGIYLLLVGQWSNRLAHGLTSSLINEEHRMNSTGREANASSDRIASRKGVTKLANVADRMASSGGWGWARWARTTLRHIHGQQKQLRRTDHRSRRSPGQDWFETHPLAVDARKGCWTTVKSCCSAGLWVKAVICDERPKTLC